MKKSLLISKIVILLASFQLLFTDELLNGLKTLSLTADQEKELEDGKIIFIIDSRKKGSVLVHAAILFPSPLEQTWQLIYRTEDQSNYLDSVKESRIIKKYRENDCIYFKVGFFFIKKELQLLHQFDWNNFYMKWTLDPDFPNEVEEVKGYWKFYTFSEGKTLGLYGTSIAVKGVPTWLENWIKKKIVKKSLQAVKIYVENTTN